MMINGEPVDALSFICHTDKAYNMGKSMVDKLKGVVDRWENPIMRVALRLNNI